VCRKPWLDPGAIEPGHVIEHLPKLPVAKGSASIGFVMKARVTVTLKSGILDPQGKAIEGALRSLGIDGVASVRQGKVFDIEIADGDRTGVEAALKKAAEKLLANTVIENYRVEVLP
jgi:phosphoribosylformylglycinamidine synthase subunit PurS